MARARNIKPGFFKNELLAELEPLDRLLFIGLWCLADREGRLEDRHKRIKMELFPCDSYDVNGGLAALEAAGFVSRYSAAGKSVVSIVNFHKHQTPHGTEKDSELPGENGELTVHERTEGGYTTGKKRANNVKKGADNVEPPLGTGAKPVNPPGHNALNPESGFLNPESLTEAKASLSPDKSDAVPHCPHTELIDLYAEQLPTLPQPKPELWTGARATALKARWRWVLTAKKRDGTRYATSREEALDWFKRFFAFVAESDFLTGRDGKWTACDLGWLCNETNFAKVVQGNYTNKEAA